MKKEKIKVQEDLCIGCGVCVSVCPMAVLELGEKATVVNAENCILCKQCEENCPVSAIIFEEVEE